MVIFQFSREKTSSLLDNEPTRQLGASSKRDVSKYLPTFIGLIVGQFHLFKTNR